MARNAKWPFAELRSKIAHRLVRSGRGEGTPSTSPWQGPRQAEPEKVVVIVWGGLGQAWP